MSDPVRFLNGCAHALAVMTLYPEGHPSRERAVDAAYVELDGMTTAEGHLSPSSTATSSTVASP